MNGRGGNAGEDLAGCGCWCPGAGREARGERASALGTSALPARMLGCDPTELLGFLLSRGHARFHISFPFLKIRAKVVS